MEKNITKIFGATTNNTISSLFNNCTLHHPSLTDNQYMYINTKTNFIRVGDKSDCKDFNDWNAAAEYANNRKGEFYVGVRAYRKAQANVMAIIKNV